MKSTIKNHSITFGLLVTVVLFLVLTVISKIYPLSDLPLQTIGALFGSVITAVITYFLFRGQSESEEQKEIKVAHFNIKQPIYQDFISELWTKWEDREIDLYDVKWLLDEITKNIVMYLPKEKSELIYDRIEILGEIASKKLDIFKRKENEKEVIYTQQDCIFHIIDTLCDDIKLDSKISNSQIKINLIEGKIKPIIDLEDARSLFMTSIQKEIDNSDINIIYKNDTLKFHYKNSKLNIFVQNIDKNEQIISVKINDIKRRYNKFSMRPNAKAFTDAWELNHINFGGTQNPHTTAIKTDLNLTLNEANSTEKLKYISSSENFKNAIKNICNVVNDIFNNPRKEFDDKNLKELIEELENKG